MQLIGNSRQAVRDAVRAHQRAPLVLKGRRVNSLSKDELLTVAATLGIDVAAIVRAEQGGATTAPTRAESAKAQAAPEPPPANVLNWDADQDADQGAPAPIDATDAIDVTAEATALRRDLSTAMVEGDFDRVTARIADLLTAARKPAETITVIEYRDTPAGGIATSAAPVPPKVATVATWKDLFGVKSQNGANRINVYVPGPQTPAIDQKYKWPDHVTEAALHAIVRDRNVWLYGPAGTGKTSFAEQLAARTGRPFILIPCDDTTEAPELVGMTVPHQGGTRWQDGVLTAAMRTPHAIILVDEPTVARAGAVMVLQSVLQSKALTIKETGEHVKAATGVRFLVADNTNGTGGGTAEGYEGTRRMNRATLDRFSAFLRVDYMAPNDEARVLVSRSGCTNQLAKILVECAGLTRKARVTHALGLRRLIAWAEALTDGVDPRAALEFTILNSCARDDREPTEQCCALGLDKKAIGLALQGLDPAPPAAPSAPLSAAAADFAN